MSPAAPKLSIADQALANALGFLACQRIEDDRTAIALAQLADHLPPPGAVPPSGVMLPLHGAAREVLRAAPDRGGGRGSVAWCQAMLTASAAVADFLFWRASLAVDALSRSQPQKGAPHAAE
jgi:hypothetical protein